MKFETTFKTNVMLTQGGKTIHYPKQERVVVSSTSDFLAEVTEINNNCLSKIEIGYAGDIYFFTKDGKRINVYLKPKYNGGELLEIGMNSVDSQGKIIEETGFMLKGKWKKEKICPTCRAAAINREEGFIDLKV